MDCQALHEFCPAIASYNYYVRCGINKYSTPELSELASKVGLLKQEYLVKVAVTRIFARELLILAEGVAVDVLPPWTVMARVQEGLRVFSMLLSWLLILAFLNAAGKYSVG